MPNANFPTVVDRMDVTNDPTSATTTWTTLVDANGKSLVKSFSCHSGRTYELGRTDTGTTTVEVENSDGRFDPTNTTSPLNSAGKLLLPMRRYNRQATWNGVTYDVWTGFVERYPQRWAAAGFLGAVALTCVDALAPLSRVDLPSLYQAEVLSDAPMAYYPMTETSGSSVGSTATTPQPPATIEAAKNGGYAYEFTSPGPLVGEDSLGWVHFDRSGTDANTVPASQGNVVVLTANADGGTGPYLPTTGGFTVELIASWTEKWNTLFNQIGAGGAIQVQIISTDPYIYFYVADEGLVNVAQATIGGSIYRDGQPHQLALTLSSDRKTVTGYIDHVAVATGTAAAAVTWARAPKWVQVGGTKTAYSNSGFMRGHIGHVSLYGSTLSSTRILVHHNMMLGMLGDGTGTRAERYMNSIGWPTAARDMDVGLSTVGAFPVSGSKAFQVLGDLTEWEAGCLFIAPDGKVTFRQRDARFNATSLATFGDGAGELPYEGDIEFDFDNTSIYNDVQVDRVGGASVRVTDDTSQDRYFPSTLAQTIGIDSDAQTVDRANYLLGAYKDPHLRLQTMTIKPSSNTALWPHALGRKIGDRITVKKHAGSAPDISADFFIESVDHVVPGDGTWTTTWQLSPAGSGISDFWVVEDNTFGYIEGSGGNVSYPIAF